MLRKLPNVKVYPRYIPFKGGLDTETPAIEVRTGRLRHSQNIYQDINGGYRTFKGYERYSGKTRPSSAGFSVLNEVTITGTINVGDTVTNDGATVSGKVLAIPDGKLVLGRVSGTFSAGNLRVGGTIQGTCGGTPVQSINSAETRQLTAVYFNLAADDRRADIAAVTGSGSVLGVWYYNGAWYAFRNNTLGTDAAMYKASSSGWALVDLGRELSFTNGGKAPANSPSPSEGTPSGSPSEGTPSSSPSSSASEGTPSDTPSNSPSNSPSDSVSSSPSNSPSEGTPSSSTSSSPSGTASASSSPSASPSEGTPSDSPSTSPSEGTPSDSPSGSPSDTPSSSPSEGTPSDTPSSSPSAGTPSSSPSEGSPSPSTYYEIQEGDVITGNHSGAQATVTRVVLESGSWDAGTAAGRLIFATQTGTFMAENLNVGGNTDVAAITGNSTAIVFDEPSGRFEFDNTNFSGSSYTYRMYGCDGMNRAFEFDGSVFVPISTGMTDDTPSHIKEHQNQLFLSFGPSVQHSGVGEPYVFSAVLGAAELGMGDDVTGFVPQLGSESGGAMTIFTQRSYGILYGTSSADWVLVHKRDSDAGAFAYSAQRIGHTYSLDERGVSQLAVTDQYGNFADSTISQHILSWIWTKRSQLTASCVIKSKSQLWFFFADKSALCCTVSQGNIVAMCPMLFKHKVTCVCSAETATGDEVVMFGSDDGYVYELYRGTSFDGDEIEWYADLVYDHCGLPEVNKRFLKATFEVFGDGFAEYLFSYSLSYDSGDTAPPSTDLAGLQFNPQLWDSGITWDSGVRWDGRSLEPKYSRIYGTGTNISLKLKGRSDFHNSIKFSNALVQYKITREKR